MSKIEHITNKGGQVIYPITKEEAVFTEDNVSLTERLANKQDTLVSGENIKTVNDIPIVGSGNIAIPKGDTPQISIGTVETGPGGSAAEVELTGTDAAPVFNFKIPQGIQGAPGREQARYKKVDSLPEASASTMDFIYLTETATSGVYNMSYTELNQGAYSWQSLGTTAMQLDDYATKESVSELKDELVPLTATGTKRVSVDPSSLGVRNYYIDSSTGKYTSNNNYKHSLVPVQPGQVAVVTSNNAYNANVSFFKTNAAPVSGGTPDYSTEYSSIYKKIVPIGETQSFIVPSDAYYMYIYRGYNSATPPYPYTPAAISIMTSTLVPEETLTIANPADSASANLVADAVANRYETEILDLSLFPERDLAISSGNAFLSSGKNSFIEVYPGAILKVVGGGGRAAFVSKLNAQNSGSTVGAIEAYTLEDGVTYILRAPEDAVGFIYNTLEGEEDVAPSTIEVSTPIEERDTFRIIPAFRWVPSGGVMTNGSSSSNINYLIKVLGGHYYCINMTANTTIGVYFTPTLPSVGVGGYSSIDIGENSNTIGKYHSMNYNPQEDGYILFRCYKSSGPEFTLTVTNTDALREKQVDFKPYWRIAGNSLTKRNYAIDSNLGLYLSSTAYKHVIIPVRPGQLMRITPHTGIQYARFAWFTNDDAPTSYGVPPFVPGTTVVYASDGIYKVPEGANYVWVYYGDATGSLWPSYLAFSVDYESMPDIVIENDYEKTRRLLFQLKSTTRAENDVPYKPLVLLHYSDIHGRTTCQNRINDFREFWSDYIDDTIQTGDLVTSYWGDGSAFDEEVEPEVNPSKDILCVIGNHDTASKSGNTFYWHTYQGKQAYDRYISPYVANWNVEQPENAAENGYCFYYKDYADSKIRLIVLDTFNTDDAYEATQQSWFTDVLNDAILEGLSVIVASHFRIKCETLLKSPFTCPGAAVENPDTSVCNDPYVPLVKNFIDNGGKFVCWITGHSHYDAISKTSEEQGSQINICVNRAGAYGSTSTSLWETNSRINVDFSDWKTFDCFNVMAIDTYYKYITLYRVGSNWDKMGRNIETCCIKYDTGEILYP